MKRYHGPKVTIEPDYASEWSAVPHFYFGFYVWQYATSITAANYFAQKLMHGTPADRERLSDHACDRAVRTMAITCSRRAASIWPTAEPYRLIVDSFSKVLDQAEALLA